MAIARPALTQSRPSAGECFVAADVGGTHVRLGLVRADAAGQPLDVVEYRKYRCADYPGLAEIIETYLRQLPGAAVTRGVIASAGHPLEDGNVIAANLPWKLSPAAIRQQLGFDDLRLVNDFEALAHAVARLDGEQAVRLSGPAVAPTRGPVLVVGPGTGLGAAVWIPSGAHPNVQATEAGQATLAVGNERELALLALLLRERTHVPAEHALSGPGLLNLYRAACALRDEAPALATPDAVTAAALAGSDAAAREALETFCALLGGFCGDLALSCGIQGGVYLAGGILPHLGDFLLQSGFAARFLDKGPMRDALQRIPVKLVEHGQLGVIGAANWYLARPPDG